jgi:prephenate dehydrogenase
MEGLVRQMLPDLAPRTLVTDVGSVKGVVVETLAPLLEGRALFTGSHPMAGSEKAGIRFARADLFANATCIVTPRTPQESSSEAVARAKELWECLGGRVAFLGPHEHDRFCALISHMPHLLAAVLVHAVQASEPRAFAFCGPGFRDTTRVAGGLPEMWREILCSNREAVLEALNAVSHQIELAKALLHAPGSTAPGSTAPGSTAPDSLLSFLAAAKSRRDTL